MQQEEAQPGRALEEEALGIAAAWMRPESVRIVRPAATEPESAQGGQ